MDSPNPPPPHCGLNPSKCFFVFFLNFPKSQFGRSRGLAKLVKSQLFEDFFNTNLMGSKRIWGQLIIVGLTQIPAPTLTVQYRMAAEIADFANRTFYSNKVRQSIMSVLRE